MHTTGLNTLLNVNLIIILCKNHHNKVINISRRHAKANFPTRLPPSKQLLILKLKSLHTTDTFNTITANFSMSQKLEVEIMHLLS